MELLIAAIQNSVYKAPPEKSFNLISLKAESIVFREGAYLIAYPELMNTPSSFLGDDFSYVNYAEEMHGETVKRTLELAITLDVHIIGTILEKCFENNQINYYNTAFVCSPTRGIIGKYRKNSLFQSNFTSEIFNLKTSNKDNNLINKIPAVSLDSGVKVGIIIGNDSLISEIWKDLVSQDTQLIIIPAAFHHKTQLLYLEKIKRLALKYNVFVLIINKFGKETIEKQEINYFGQSCLINPSGQIILQANDEEWAELICNIDLSESQI